jgi:hypothetical protein
MTTSPTASKALPPTHPQDRFSVQKTTSGGITFLTLHGTLNEAFEGRKIAESVRTKKLVVSMRDVRRFASWGMSEWMDFLRITADRDLYLVECSTYSLSQINLVTGLLGHGKLVSFYAAYRCGSCSEERDTLFIVPRDRERLPELPGSYQECTTCAGRARLEEYPAAFFDKIAERPLFDIDDEVLAFLRSHFGYDLAPDLTRFRAFRRFHNGYTYLRLSGDIARLPSDVLTAASEGTTVIDLAGIVFDPAQVSEWRTYVQGALYKLKSLQLLNCPPWFLESAISPEDLRDKLKIRTFALSYDCLQCETRTAYMVDVAENLEQLVAGVAPAVACPVCQSSLVPVLSAEQLALMRFLPARDRDPALDKLLAAAQREPPEKLENCLAPQPARPQEVPGGPRRLLYVALALAVLLIGSLTAVVVTLWKRGGELPPAGGLPTPAADIAAKSQGSATPERPEWIVSVVPLSAYCHDLINRLMCVGVSSYRRARDEAVAEANDAALEELVSAVGLKISEPFFRETIVGGYSAVRSKALSVLQATELERAAAPNAAAAAAVAKARKRVGELLHASGGAAVPAQRTDWYWEEYAAQKGGGTEFLVFIRYDVPLDAIKALVEKYSANTSILGSTAITAFPALAWQFPDFITGAMLTKVGSPLAGTGIAPQSVITAVGEQRVNDAASLAKRIQEWKQGSGPLKLMVKTGDAAEKVIEIPRQRVP